MSMMKRVLSLAFVSVIFGVSTFAGTPEKLELTRLSNGQVNFGFTYMPEENLVYIVTGWNGVNLLKGQPIRSLKYAVYNPQTKKFLSAWVDYGYAGMRFPGAMALSTSFNAEEGRALILQSKTSQLVFSLDTAKDSHGEFPITHFIDIGELCSTAPGNFINVSTNTRGCR